MKLLLVVLAFALAAEALRTHQLVVFNIGKLKGPLGSEAVSEFERALGPINDLRACFWTQSTTSGRVFGPNQRPQDVFLDPINDLRTCF